jgi:hypothetical protein
MTADRHLNASKGRSEPLIWAILMVIVPDQMAIPVLMAITFRLKVHKRT